MTPPPGKMSKLFGALGADESAFDARVKAAANDAKQRWPMFKSLVPESNDLPPLLSEAEKSRRPHVAPEALAQPRPALSRPGLSAKLSKGLSKIARQTSAEVRGSAKRAAPVQPDTLPAEPLAPLPTAQRASLAFAVTPEPAPALFAAPASVPEAGLFTKAFAATPSPVAAPVAPMSSADDALSSVFQRLEGQKPQSKRSEEKPATKVAGVMSRLGRR